MYLLSLAVAPAVAIILFILYRDKFDREPAGVLFASFFCGILVTLPAMAVETFAGLLRDRSAESAVLFAFFGVALVEEASKFLPLRYYAFTRRSFDEPLDGIVHGVMVGMGFAAVENIGYVYQHGSETGWLRMFTAVPAHASWGIVMGYYVGKAKFNYQHRRRLFFTGFFLAVFFHGLYDACLFVQPNVSDDTTRGVLLLAALATHVVAVLLAIRLLRQHHRVSKALYRAPPAFSTRTAALADLPLIRTLAHQIWPVAYRTILSGRQLRYMLKLIYSKPALARQMAEGQRFSIIYNNAVPVGFVAYGEVEPQVYKLHKIYVLPNQQGRGTGKFAMDYVMAESIAGGGTRLRLNVNRFNPAKGFYEKLGFAVVKEEKIEIGSGYVMDDFVMERRITDMKD